MYNYYIVRSGDTLTSIARQYNTTASQLSALNNLADNKILMPGEVITVPLTGIKPQDNLGSIPTDEVDFFTRYVVRRGDTLSSIARKYNIPVLHLMLLNGIKNNTVLQVGQSLIVPRPNIHILLTKNGDSIESISKEININISDLLNYNDNIYLLPNQLLIYWDDNM